VFFARLQAGTWQYTFCSSGRIESRVRVLRRAKLHQFSCPSNSAPLRRYCLLHTPVRPFGAATRTEGGRRPVISVVPHWNDQGAYDVIRSSRGKKKVVVPAEDNVTALHFHHYNNKSTTTTIERL
jgi:hypothetical protein